MEITAELLDCLSSQAQKNEKRRQSFDLRNTENDTSQRMLNAMEPGTHIDIHRHMKSSEIVIVIRGAIKENYYNENGELITSHLLKSGTGIPMIVVPIGTWHNVECIEHNTIIFECKDGPYASTPTEDIMVQ